jgi:hypothetical protein
MICRSATLARPAFAVAFGKQIVLAILILQACRSAEALDLAIGPKETIYTASQRKAKGLSSWPDGNLGVVANGTGGLDFYGANSGSPVKVTGTLTNPDQSKKSVNISGLPKKTFDYVSGGPVYYDEASGAHLMIYHAEIWGKSAKDYHSMLGMAVSTDPAGLAFKDLGTIVEPNLQKGFAEVGGGSFAILGNYMDVYYRDWGASGGTSELAVARAPISDLISNALSGVATPFSKYYGGSWSQPGRGGMSSPLEVGNPYNSWSAVSYNDYLNQLVMVTSQPAPSGEDLYLASSADGVNWSPRQPIALDPGEQFYPSLIGTGPNPQITGQSFYVYYTDSKKGAFSRWSDAQLARRQITIDPLAPPVVQPPVVPPPSLTGWAAVSDYASDFRIDSPATGWKYDWNPTGKLGNSATFAPLVWSDVAQAYNTTGGATDVPGKKSHNDDYLTLTASGGHPGQPKYLAIAGYTIQGDDGAGLYRIADSSISKDDSITSKGEDGLQVLVYVNNKQVGTAQAVSTNGQLAHFDLTLGQLNVGDTVWVMVDPLKNQSYDSFMNFDFAIQKSVPQTQLAQAVKMSLVQGPAVPEPETASLLLIGLAGLFFGRSFASRQQLL